MDRENYIQNTEKNIFLFYFKYDGKILRNRFNVTRTEFVEMFVLNVAHIIFSTFSTHDTGTSLINPSSFQVILNKSYSYDLYIKET